MLTQSSRDRNISKNLAWFATYVHLSNGQGKMDINHDAEDFYCGLLNILFTNNSNHGFADKEVQLHNMNSIQMDYPAIDLGDEQNRLCVQITASEHRDKVRTTLKKFLAHNLDATYDRLIVLMIGTKDEFTKKFDVERNFDFDASRDVWDTNRLGAEIGKLSDERRQMLANYIDDRVETQKEKTVHLHLPLSSALQATGFVGREAELAEIGERFEQGDKLVVLTGLGGMGKTELAVRFGLNYLNGNVYFIKFEDSCTHTIAKMASGIRPELPNEQQKRPDNELCAAVLNILENHGPKDILIIDNVDSDHQRMSDLMKDSNYKKLTQLNLRLIITTRFERSQSLGIGRMTDEQLLKIFQKYSCPVTIQQAKDLIDVVNGHTLTIDLIARTLADKWEPVTPADMLNALKNSSLADGDFAEVETYYNQSPEQVQIYEHLRAVFRVAKIPPVGQSILRCATLLPETGMYFDLFRKSLPEEWQKSLASLGRHGWLEMKDGLLTIHPVIRLVCRTELTPTDDNCGDFLDKLCKQVDTCDYNRHLFSQLADVFTNATASLGNHELKWFNITVFYLVAIGSYSRALDLYSQILPTVDNNHIPPDKLSIALNNLAHISWKTGNPESELNLLLSAVKIAESITEQDSHTLGILYNNIGTAYGHMCQPQTERKYLLKAATILEQIPLAKASYSVLLATIYDNIGQSYLTDNTLGEDKITHALDFALKAISVYENHSLPATPDLAIIYDNVSLIYQALDEMDLAVEYAEKAFSIFTNKLPPIHADLATSYQNLGRLYLLRKKYSEALKHFTRALSIRKKLTPKNPVDIAHSFYAVGVAFYHLRNPERALSYFNEAQKLYIQYLPSTESHLIQVNEYIHLVQG